MCPARATCSQTRWIMLFPRIWRSGFPGRRCEPYRAGMIAIVQYLFMTASTCAPAKVRILNKY
jgi:hypothetical protein